MNLNFGKHGAVRNAVRWMAAAALIFLSAGGVRAFDDAQAVPPPAPEIPPFITYPADLDRDLDRLDDALNDRLATLRARIAGERDAAARAELMMQLQEPVAVETLFSEPITQRQLDAFVELGGRIRYIYKHVSYGWGGTIPLVAVERAPEALGPSFIALLAEHEVRFAMDEATRTGRVRPVWASGFAGSASGFSGSSTTSIAVLDSGVDGTHTDLAGRMRYWKDWIGSSPSPVDYDGHGTHVAGIALGSGAASGSSPTSIRYTDSGDLTGLSSGYFYPSPIHIPAGSASMQMTATFLGGGTAYLDYVYADNGSMSYAGPAPSSGSSPYSRTRSFTATAARRYSVYFSKAGGTVSRYGVATTATAAGLGDGFNLLRGVAPGAYWVGQRVNDGGSGSSLTLGYALDDCVTYRQTYNIKVVNLSLGTTTPDSTTRNKVNTVVGNGIVVAAAAGNTGPSGIIMDPGRAKLALTVGASSDVNRLTEYTSNGGFTQETNTDYKPDIMAPGGSDYQSNIMSVDTNQSDAQTSSFGDVQANDYANYSGTSMATPFAAGAAALVIEALEAGGLTWSFSSDAHPRLVKMLLCATATESNANREAGGYNPTLGRATTPRDNYEGYGVLNVDAAVEAAYQLIVPGETINGTTTGGQYDRRAWGRKIALTNGVQVTLNLTVPGTGDYDLYLYSGTPSTSGTPVRLASSTSAGSGVSESIVYTPSATGVGYIVVKRISGSGSWSLTYSGGSASITVTAPNGGESWSLASSRTVNWTYSGSPGANVSVELLKSGSLHRTLVASTPVGSGGSGSYAWTIADDLTPASDYSIKVTSTSTSASDTSDANFTISQAPTATSAAGAAGKIGETVDLQATLTRTTDGAPLASRTIAFQVAGSSAGSAATDGSGVATRSFTIPGSLGVGPAAIRADFAGDTGHMASFGTATLTVSKGDTALAVASAGGQVGASVTLSATLTCVGNGAPLAGQTVEFAVEGSGVGSASTNGSGVAELGYAIPEASGSGDRAIQADYAGDGSYLSSFGVANLTVSKGDTALALSPAGGQIGATVTLSATLTCVGNGLGVSGRTVAFSVEGSSVGSAPTDGAGVAELGYQVPVGSGPGARGMQADFAGDALYEASMGSSTLTIDKADTMLAVVADGSVRFNEDATLRATLTRATDGVALESRIVGFSVEGTSVGDGTTDAAGEATIHYTIPEALGRGQKTIQADYAGDANHSPGMGTGALTVIGWPTALAVGDAAGMVSETVNLSAGLTRTDNSTPLAGRTVRFTVEGTDAGSGTTDASGNVTVAYAIPDTVGSGALSLQAHFDGDADHEPATGSATITVTKASTSIYVQDRTGTITETVTLRGYLRRTADDAWVQGRTVAFQIDGTPVGSGTTNADGRADLNWVISDGPASRTILAEFAGDAAYTGSSGTATLTCLSWATKMASFDRTARITDRTELKCRLLRSDNAPLYNKSVNFYVDGTFIIARPTNVDGYASYLFYDVPDGSGAGVRTILSEWPGNGGYAAISKTATLTVLKAIPYIWVLPKSVPQGGIANLYAYFRRLYDYKKQEGKTVDFKLDGTVIQTVVTGSGDQGGIARYLYPTTEVPGVYKIRCEFYGDAWVEPGYGEGNLTIY